MSRTSKVVSSVCPRTSEVVSRTSKVVSRTSKVVSSVCLEQVR